MYPPMQYFGGLGAYGAYGNLGLYGALVPYGTLNLTESSPPQTFTEVFTTDDARAILNLPPRSPADPQEEALLQAFVVAARIEAEIAQNRDLTPKQWDLSLDYWNSYRIELRAPLQSVDLVQYMQSDGSIVTMAENTDFVVDKKRQPGAIEPPFPGPTNRTWPTFTPWPSSAITIRFTSGYPANSSWWSDTGALVKNGMRYLISLWYTNRLPFVVGSAASDAFTLDLLSRGAVPRVR